MIFKRIILYTTVLSAIIISMGCKEREVRLCKLDYIDSLMEQNPDASYDSLCKFSDSIECNEEIKMKYRILKAKVQNRLYYKMPSSIDFQEIADYYEQYGTSDEKMLAMYLLGCAFRDEKESPKAIQCYKRAIEYADTLNTNCDYNTLYRIYGQIAIIYESQYLVNEAIDAYSKYSYYALKVGKNEDYINGKLSLATLLQINGDTLKSIEKTKECINLYVKNGLYSEAASSVQSIIDYHLYRRDFDSTYYYIQIYESYSGLFRNGQTIEAGYYNVYKGKYYEGIGKLDSAEYFYRKLPKYGYNNECYRGLLNIYTNKMVADSMRKYICLYEASIDSIIENNQMNAVKIAEARFNYNRLERENLKAKHKEDIYMWIFTLIVLSLIFIVSLLLIHFHRYKRMKRMELKNQNRKFIRLKRKLQIAENELQQMISDNSVAIKDKQEEIEILQHKIDKYEATNSSKEIEIIQKMENLSDRFSNFANPKTDLCRPEKSDWKDLTEYIKVYYTTLYFKLSQGALSQQELNVCMLTFINIQSCDITVIMGVSAQRVTNLKTSANEKLFGVKNAKSLYANMINLKR